MSEVIPRQEFNEIEPVSKEIYVDPRNATLETIMQREARMTYIPRKIDIERFKDLSIFAATNRPDRQDKDDTVRVLDVGGGHGFIDKLLADEFNLKDQNALVVDLDINAEVIQGAKKAYEGTKGLAFVQSNAEIDAASIFNKSFDLVIASWPVKRKFCEDYRYTDLIHDNRPPFVVWVGDEAIGDVTGEFDPKNDYELLALWHGRHNSEINSKVNFHGRTCDPEKGANLYMVYVRNDLNPQIEQIKEILDRGQEGEEYSWESGLNKIYPKDSSAVSFEVN